VSISPDEFIRAYPKLFHVSLARDLGQILHHGLLSTTALLDLCEYEGENRSPIESCQRTNAVSLSHPVHGEFLINDQAPMSESALRRCLIDLTPREWYESLNRRVFFWPTHSRLEKHLAARLSRGRQRLVLSLDTRSLLDVLDVDLLELSPINSGNTMRKAARRGSETFLKLRAFPFHERRRAVGLRNAVAEVTYPHALGPDILEHLAFSSTTIRHLY
jgi:hypothetical protein